MNKFFVSSILSLIFSGVLIAQTLSNPVTIAPSPQSETFMKYGEYNINYSTGVPNISVPLYEIDHHGFKIPVSLSYYYQGLKPGYNVDVFGLGWGVNPTGKISREIRYKPDEENDFVVDAKDPGLESYNLLSTLYSNPREFNHSADLFHVSLPSGLSFDFTVVKENGNYNVSVSNGEPVVINLTGPSGVNHDMTWEIIDKDGIKYTFLISDAEKVLYGSSSGAVSTWNLSRIDLPNSDEPIKYTYKKGILNRFNEPNIRASVSDYNDNNYCNNISNELNYQTYLLKNIVYGDSYINFTYNDVSTTDYVDHNFIKSISIGETGVGVIKKVNFNMSDKGNHLLFYSIPLMRLNSITISGTSETLPPKMYNFSYDDMSTFVTKSTDHWGYLNNEQDPLFGTNFPAFHIYLSNTNGNGNLSCYDGATTLPNDGYKLGSASKQSFGEHGVLNKIIYPTGGYTEFLFEPNSYEVRVPTDSLWLGAPQEAAGFRIEQISNYTSDNILASKKAYKYGKQLESSYTSGPKYTGVGIAPVEPNALSYLNYKSYGFSYHDLHNFLKLDPLNPSPAIIIHTLPYPDQFNAGFEHIFSSSVFKSILNGRPPVVYPEVTVYTGEFRGGQTPLDRTLGKTVYKYDYLDYDGNFIEPWSLGKDGSSSYISKDYRYNRLVEQIDYKREDVAHNTNGSEPIQSEYTRIRKIENQWVYFSSETFTENKLIRNYPNVTPSGLGLPDHYFSNHSTTTEKKSARLTQKTITSYISSTDSIQTKELFGYNGGGFLIHKTFENSDNIKTITRYNYPENYSGNTVLEAMNSDTVHILSPVIESTTYFKNGANPEVLVSGTKTDYKEFIVNGNSLFVPEKQIYKDKSNTETIQLTILSYTANGNPKEVMGKDGVVTSYLWGYNDRYPVAKVVNATAVQLEATLTAIELTNIKNGAYDRAAMINALNKIRTELPDHMVTTYTYSSLLGTMTSITDPKGETIYYEYDHFGRLLQVKDTQGKILSENQYHYKGQQ